MKNILFAIGITLLAVNGYAQQKIIKMDSVVIYYQPVSFYLAGIKDLRNDTSTIGYIGTTRIDMEHGLSAGLFGYISRQLKPDTKLAPVYFQIHDFTVKGEEKLTIEANVSFSDGKKILSSTKTMNMVNGPVTEKLVAEQINERIVAQLKEADLSMQKKMPDWVANFGKKPNVEVKILAAHDGPELVYRRSQPLKPEDFKGKVDSGSLSVAVTYSGIRIQHRSSKMNGVMKYTAILTPYFDHERSWWAVEQGDEERVLAHEQLHFDITAYYAYVLAGRLKYAQPNAEGKIDFESLVTGLEKERLQMQSDYDSETAHGTIPASQTMWKLKVNALLDSVYCF